MYRAMLRILCLAAGVRSDALERAPEAMGAPATWGLLVVIISVISFCNASYALHRVFGEGRVGDTVSIVGGLLWAFLVFAIERSIVSNSVDSGWRSIVRLLARAAVGVGLALSISIPLFLRLARGPIDLGNYLASRDILAATAAQNAQMVGLTDLAGRSSSANDEVRKARQAIEDGPLSSPAYAAALRNRDAVQSRYTDLEGELANLETRVGQLGTDAQSDNPLTGEIARVRAETEELGNVLASANNDLRHAESEWRSQTSGRLTYALRDLTTASRDEQKARDLVENEDSKSRLQVERNTGNDLASEYARAQLIESDRRNPYSSPLRSLAFRLDALFIALELVIVILKSIGKPSNLDKVMKEMEAEEVDKVTMAIKSRLARVRQAQELADSLFRTAVERWHAESLDSLQATVAVSSERLSNLAQECKSVISAASI